MSEKKRDETPPEWLTDSFLEKALRQSLNLDNLKILDSKTEMATAVGDNYASRLFRIHLSINEGNGDDENKKLSVLVKTLSPGMMGEESRKWDIFPREGEALSKILPRLHAILKKTDPSQDQISATCYYTQGPPHEAIVIEDLRPAGFVLGNRFEGLDMDHSILVLNSLAKLHAASLVLKKENPESLDNFMTSFWTHENSEVSEKFMKPTFKMFSKDVLMWEEFEKEKRELYSEKFTALCNEIVEKTINVWKRNDSDLNVFLHGDSWVNNFLFRYDTNGKVSKTKFVDFQLSNWNSPALDLQYFIFTSTAPNLRFERVDDFLKIYYEAFVSTLEKLNHKCSYSFEQLKKDFDKRYHWGFTVFCTIFPFIIQTKENTADPNDLFSESKMEAFCEKLIRDDIRAVFKDGLPFFESKGVF